MKTGFYTRIAIGNIAKNRRFFVPHILTGTGLTAAFFIIYTLATDKRLKQVKGGSYLPVFMSVGSVVIGLISAILLMYTARFLMKQRRREFGLYNVLGMEKRHVGRVLGAETLIGAIISIASGLLLGMLLYKLCSLLICRLLGVGVIPGFYYLSSSGTIVTALLFAAFYLLTYIAGRAEIAFMKPVNMLSGARTGEKEPRVKWLILILGILTLGAGYVLAVTVTEPLMVLYLFFAAVFLVIIGTYCLFTAGSTFALKALKRSPSIYYDKNRMPAIAGLMFRMKHNAVGLASVAILSTGVLIMISSTVSLYSGMNDTIAKNYPQDLYLQASYHPDVDGSYVPIPAEGLAGIVKNAAQSNGLEIASIENQTYLEVGYLLKGDELITDRNSYASDLSGSVVSINYITRETYRSITGEALELSGDEIAVCVLQSEIGSIHSFGSTLTIHGKAYSIKTVLDSFPLDTQFTSVVTGYGIVVPDEAAFDEINRAQAEAYGENASKPTIRIAVSFTDSAAAAERNDSLRSDVFTEIGNYVKAHVSYDELSFSAYLDTVETAREELVGMYATFLFLGIILGTVCLFAAVLVIYCKQISEGYDDRERFSIMKKIGIGEYEIKRIIRSQTLMMFFLPLIAAAVHTAFAFPMVNRMLHLLLLSSTHLYVICSLIVLGVFALTYTFIYRQTARTYYKIVR